jgi:hypothetical protein
MFEDLFSFLFDDVLGIVQMPDVPKPPAEEELAVMTPTEVSETELEELQKQRRRAAQSGGFFGSILTGGSTQSSLMS